MTFLATLIALLIERFFDWSHLRHWQWFLSYQRWLLRALLRIPSPLLIAISIAPPALIVLLISMALTGWFYDFFKLVFVTIVLLYSLGPKNFWAECFVALNTLQHDDQNAFQKIKQQFQFDTPNNSAQNFHQKLVRRFFIEGYKRVFAVIFWFAVLGPVGAVLYRTVVLSQSQIIKSADEKTNVYLSEAFYVQCVLDWVPIRILTLIFALAGHFTDTMIHWKKSVFRGLSHNEFMLIDCGIAASDIEHQGKVAEDGSAEKIVLELLDRSFVITLVGLAVIVIVLS